MRLDRFIILFGILLFSIACTQVNETDTNEKKAKDLLSKMTIEEKIGQMAQVNYMAFSDLNDISKYNIGGVAVLR